MEKLNLQFTARAVDAIEKAAGVPIENVISDTRIANIATVLRHSLIDDNTGRTGVSMNVIMDTIDARLKEYDRFDIILDITEGLVEAGFLPRTMDVEKMREQKSAGAIGGGTAQ